MGAFISSKLSKSCFISPSGACLTIKLDERTLCAKGMPFVFPQKGKLFENLFGNDNMMFCHPQDPPPPLLSKKNTTVYSVAVSERIIDDLSREEESFKDFPSLL